MNFEKERVEAQGIRISVRDNETEVGRAHIYWIYNDLHNQPFALMEDVYVDESYRCKGVGPNLVKQVVELAKEANCYKLIATSRTSRPQTHELYKH